MLKPILFNTDMVKAIMDGRKTVTRRLFKLKYRDDESGFQVVTTMSGKFVRVEKLSENGSAIFPDGSERFVNPPFSAGDILYVRETWCKGKVDYGEEPDGRCVPFISQCPGEDDFIPKELAIREGIGIEDVVWKPSIFMPKEAARIFLRVKRVSVERLQKCGEGWCIDIEKEGVKTPQDPILYVNDDRYHAALRAEMKKLWDSTIKPSELDTYGWDANPWVWVIEFERISKEEAGCV